MIVTGWDGGTHIELDHSETAALATCLRAWDVGREDCLVDQLCGKLEMVMAEATGENLSSI